MYERIAVGTDGSKTARVATDRAASLARALGSDLFLVHAGRGFPGLEDLARRYGADAVTAPGNPAEALIAEAERIDAGLLVVGSVGMSGARRWLLGNVPNKVSHHATTDLLIVKTDPPSGAGDYERILVGTDGSSTAMNAVDKTCALAAGLGAELLIVCAYEPPTEQELERYRSDPNDPIAQWDQDRVQKETPEEFRWRIADAAQAEDVLDRSVERAERKGVNARVQAIQGSAPAVLLSAAESEGADVVAVGNVGMAGPKRFALGNVPQRVSHHARTDVLILRTA
jgi:nucleotide-binding universal stress UspA family protein